MRSSNTSSRKVGPSLPSIGRTLIMCEANGLRTFRLDELQEATASLNALPIDDGACDAKLQP